MQLEIKNKDSKSMKQSFTKENKISAYILAVFFFQYGLVLPLILFMNSQIPLVFSTLILSILMILHNDIKASVSSIMMLLITSIYFLLCILWNQGNEITIGVIFTEYIIKSYLAFLMGGRYFEEETVFQAFEKISVVNAIILIIVFFAGLLDDDSYMRYGYAMAPSVLMLFASIFYGNRLGLFKTGLLMISFLLMIIYGSRGPILVLLLFLVLLFFENKKISKLKKLFVTIFFSAFIFASFKINLANRILSFLYYNLGFQTYSIEKMLLMLESGLAASSSGRYVLYINVINLIKENIIFGYGIGYAQIKLGYTVHNIFLQILLESGIIGLLIWMSIWIYGGIKFKNTIRYRHDKMAIILIIVLSCALGRLMLSSDMWLRPEYWLGLSLLVHNRNRRALHE